MPIDPRIVRCAEEQGRALGAAHVLDDPELIDGPWQGGFSVEDLLDPLYETGGINCDLVDEHVDELAAAIYRGYFLGATHVQFGVRGSGTDSVNGTVTTPQQAEELYRSLAGT